MLPIGMKDVRFGVVHTYIHLGEACGGYICHIDHHTQDVPALL
jgi:hypothetical protein